MAPKRSATKYVPDRGHLIWLQFDPQAGKEQAGMRPALVLSPAAYNRLTSLCILCPITSQVKGYPFEVALPSGLKIGGVVLSDHVKSVDFRVRCAEFVSRAPAPVLEEVLAKLTPLLFDDTTARLTHPVRQVANPSGRAS